VIPESQQAYLVSFISLTTKKAVRAFKN